MKRLTAIARQRCPRCLEGEVWSGRLTMRDTCPTCRLVFEREPGYFTGAMIVSYALGLPVLAVLFVAIWVVSGWDILWVVLSAEALFLLSVPLIFRYSRVIWMHFDQLVDPARER